MSNLSNEELLELAQSAINETQEIHTEDGDRIQTSALCSIANSLLVIARNSEYPAQEIAVGKPVFLPDVDESPAFSQTFVPDNVATYTDLASGKDTEVLDVRIDDKRLIFDFDNETRKWVQRG